MRSYDYCHFEITLGSDEDLTVNQVDDLRKRAALLVDEAVRQYKIAKAKEERRDYAAMAKQDDLDSARQLRASKPESEWNAHEAAFMRRVASAEYWRDVEEHVYGYAEDPERDHHFSMLRRFGGTRVSAAQAAD